jgi:hypothetical protein
MEKLGILAVLFSLITIILSLLFMVGKQLK